MHQLIFVGFIALIAQLGAAEKLDACYAPVKQQCSSHPPEKSSPCSAMYSGAHLVMPEFQRYVLKHLLNSYQYLLISANFANYERQREGFAKLFKKLSDETWDDAIDTIKYMTKRGGSMKFSKDLFYSMPNNTREIMPDQLEMTEPESLSLALDMQKDLATSAHGIHEKMTKRSAHAAKMVHDADVISFIENKFVKKHSDTIRELAGHSNDLVNLFRTSKRSVDPGLSVYLFDDYLKSLY